MSPIEQYSTDFTNSIDLEMQFTPRDGSMTQHGFMIRREYTSNSDAQSSSAVFTKPSDKEMNLLSP
jgi:hypothetical protein